MTKRKHHLFRRHGLSIVSSAILVAWICLYSVSNPDTHLGSFFGNAIADWTGMVVMVLGTKFLYEQGSKESRQRAGMSFLREHSLTIFLIITGAGWVALFAHSDTQGKWGQVVGNIVSEWTQILGVVVLTKRLREVYSKE